MNSISNSILKEKDTLQSKIAIKEFENDHLNNKFQQLQSQNEEMELKSNQTNNKLIALVEENENTIEERDEYKKECMKQENDIKR